MAGGQALHGQRTPAFRMDPDDIKIPGLDGGPDSGPEELRLAHRGRYDLEQRGAWKPGFYESIRDDGCQETVVIFKDRDGTPWLVDGLQRTLASRKAKRELKKDPKASVTIPCLSPVGGLTEVSRFALSLKMNHLRHDDDDVTRATKIADLFRVCKKNGLSDADAKRQCTHAFGLGVSVVEGALNLDGASSELKNAAKTGEVGGTVATRLAALPVAEQGPTLRQMQKAGRLTADDARHEVTKRKQQASNKKKGKDADEVHVVPPRSTIKKLLAAAEAKEGSGMAPEVDAFIRWLNGKVGPRAVPGLSPVLRVIEEGSPASDRAAE